MPAVNVNEDKTPPFWLPHRGVAGWKAINKALQYCLEQSQFELSVEGMDIQKTVTGVHLRVNLEKFRDFELPFRLIKAGETTIRCVISTLNDEVPTFTDEGATGFIDPSDDPPCIFTPTAAGVLYAQVVFDATTGLETFRYLKVAASTPANDLTNVYQQIGSWDLPDGIVSDVKNDCLGPLNLRREPPNPPSTGDHYLTAQAGDFIWEEIPAPLCPDGDIPCCEEASDGKVYVCGVGWVDPYIPECEPPCDCDADEYLRGNGLGGIVCGAAAAATATADTLALRNGGGDLIAVQLRAAPTGTAAAVVSSGASTTWGIEKSGVLMIADQQAALANINQVWGTTSFGDVDIALDAIAGRLDQALAALRAHNFIDT